MFASWRVAVVFTAANLTGGAFRGIVNSAGQAEKAVAGNEAALKRMHMVAIGAFATIGVVGTAAFLHAADAAGKYQLQMSLLQQQLGASDVQMEKIGKRIISLSSGPTRTMFGMGELSTMARGIQQSGLGADAVERLLQPIAYAAEIEKLRHGGTLDPAKFTANISATIKGLGLGAPGREQDAMHFADMFTRYASISKLDSAGLLAYENQFGMISRQAGWKADDFLEAGAFLSQMGVKPQMIGTMMKNIVTNLNPRANLTGHAANAQFAGLTTLGMLAPADPVAAKKYLAMVQKSQGAIGLPAVNPANMTPKAQEDFAEAVLRATVTSKATGGGLAGVITLLSAAGENFKKTFGDVKGGQMLLTVLRNVFNLRGLPPAIAFSQGGVKSLDDLKRQAEQQIPLDARAAMLRGEYEPMKEMLGGMINSVMVTLGGVTPGGKVTPGGPLDIMTKVLQQTETLIGQFVAWAAANPKLIAQIGTLIGVLGIGGITAALGLMAASILPLIASIATAAGTLGIGALVAAMIGPFGIVLAVGATVAGILFFITHIRSIQTALGNVGKWIHDIGGPAIGKAIQDAWNAAIYRITHPVADGLSGKQKNDLQKRVLPHMPTSMSWFAPTKGSFLAQLFPGWTEVQGGTWNKSWQAPAMRHTPGNAPGQGPQAVAFDVTFNGITDQQKMVKALEDWVNKWLNFQQNRQGGVAANPRLMPQGGW